MTFSLGFVKLIQLDDMNRDIPPFFMIISLLESSTTSPKIKWTKQINCWLPYLLQLSYSSKLQVSLERFCNREYKSEKESLNYLSFLNLLGARHGSERIKSLLKGLLFNRRRVKNEIKWKLEETMVV